MTTPTPFVSVVVVNYNGRHYLPRCLASAAYSMYFKVACGRVIVK